MRRRPGGDLCKAFPGDPSREVAPLSSSRPHPAVPYSYDDFHHPGDGYCNDDDGVIDDYNDVSEVQNCMLLSLSDLKTQSTTVRAMIAACLNDLIGMGVDGWRCPPAPRSSTST